MPDTTRLVALFKQACALTAAEQAAFVLAIRAQDPVLGKDLAELLGHPGTPSFAERLGKEYGPEVDPHISLDSAPDAERTGFTSEVVQRLAGRGRAFGRYELQGEVARGGQGAILRVWDEDLRRNLAMKVVLGKDEAEPKAETARVDSRTLGRFLEEAQVTGQLDHPGIVPVHELGLDSEGRVYFTMKLVKGEDLRSIFEQVETGEHGWSLTRALGVLLKVCDAMAYAHSKGVIHRDLKPANVMVGKYGEVYVMDWGLARVMAREDSKDIRIREEADGQSVVMSDRRLDDTPDSPLITMDGDVVGTPAYMSPEQANGDLRAMGPASDVYAMGAMLYHLLAGRMPYASPGMRFNNRAVWFMVRRGPPDPIHGLAPDVPGELVSICEKAMARDARERYPDMLALAEDLRAYLENRVVHAHETGAVAELRKWVKRNKALALASAAAVIALVGGLAASSSLYVEAEEKAKEASENALQAHARAREFERVAASLKLQQLLAETGPSIWRLDRDDRPLRDWIARAKELVAGLPQYRSDLVKLRGLALASDEEGDAGGPADPELEERSERLRRELERLDAGDPRRALWAQELEDLAAASESANEAGGERTRWRFATEEQQWLHDQIVGLIGAIDAMQEFRRGQLTIPSLEGRLAELEQAEQGLQGEHAERWDALAARLRERDGAVGPRPVRNLVPLGPDPDSGLEEFALVGTGSIPLRASPEEQLVTDDTSCIVLVLLPGGDVDLGKREYDFEARDNEDPWHATLTPFLIGKHEVTLGQWEHVMGDNPSSIPAGPRHPVQTIAWNRAVEFAERSGVQLPTEAQWEYASRAGSTTVYPWGDAPELAEGFANLYDLATRAIETLPWNDGFRFTSPVGSFEPNDFGLYDTQGNVHEWCRDRYEKHRVTITTPGDALAMRGAEDRVFRGASWYNRTDMARSSRRDYTSKRTLMQVLGLRVVRAVPRP